MCTSTCTIVAIHFILLFRAVGSDTLQGAYDQTWKTKVQWDNKSECACFVYVE